MTEEGEIQKAVFADLRKRGMPGVVFWHCPNDKSARRKAGYRAGVSDIHCVYRGEFFSLELKTESGVMGQEQIDFMKDIQRAKGNATVAWSLDDALSTLEAWGLLRKAA